MPDDFAPVAIALAAALLALWLILALARAFIRREVNRQFRYNVMAMPRRGKGGRFVKGR